MNEPIEFMPYGSETKQSASSDPERDFVFEFPAFIVERTGQWFQDCHFLNGLSPAPAESSNSTKDNVFIQTKARA